MNIESVFSHLGGMAGVGVLAGGLGVAYSQFKSGGNKAKDELIETLKESAVAEKNKADRLAQEKVTLMNSHQLQLNSLTEEIGKLKGLYQAAEKRSEDMLKILQGRNPEQEQYMKDMREFTKGVALYMKDSSEVLAGMKTFMTKLNEKAQTNETRNEKIDRKVVK